MRLRVKEWWDLKTVWRKGRKVSWKGRVKEESDMGSSRGKEAWRKKRMNEVKWKVGLSFWLSASLHIPQLPFSSTISLSFSSTISSSLSLFLFPFTVMLSVAESVLYSLLPFFNNSFYQVELWCKVAVLVTCFQDEGGMFQVSLILKLRRNGST